MAFLPGGGAALAGPGAGDGDLLSEIKSRGVLHAGVRADFPPFGYLDENEKARGFDVDILRYIADELGVELKLKVTTSRTRLPLLTSGQVDIVAASMTHTRARDDIIDFSTTYFMDGQSLLVPIDSEIGGPGDLAGKKVAVIEGATSGPNLERLAPRAELVYLKTYRDALEALARGQVDAISTDKVWCLAQAQEYPERLKEVGGPFTREPYGLGLPENESDWRDFVNATLQKMWQSGEYAKIYRKHFDQAPVFAVETWPAGDDEE
jgi:polar amino acid transport system substrate-binding protein